MVAWSEEETLKLIALWSEDSIQGISLLCCRESDNFTGIAEYYFFGQSSSSQFLRVTCDIGTSIICTFNTRGFRLNVAFDWYVDQST